MRHTAPRIMIALMWLVAASCAPSPDRPAGVPESALWAPSEDGGGIWADCGMRFKEPTVGYFCSNYAHPDGEFLPDQGVWILVRGPDNDLEAMEGPFWSGLEPERYSDGALWVSSSLRLIPMQNMERVSLHRFKRLQSGPEKPG